MAVFVYWSMMLGVGFGEEWSTVMDLVCRLPQGDLGMRVGSRGVVGGGGARIGVCSLVWFVADVGARLLCIIVRTGSSGIEVSRLNGHRGIRWVSSYFCCICAIYSV